MSNNSKVLALKYRPKTFKDLIGQETVAEVIYNSIANDRSANAYLFTGIRGVGKTTIARIVAKSLNCLKGIDKLCTENFCENCQAISNSNHIDVLEMDAASKTGVEDVRDLIEFSRYGPTSAKYKIFIIDEVHMLSKQAFNALLKTLEEPPQYSNGGGLKFIFATTEIKKIPITVVSRCQRFDLSRVKSEMLFDFIKKIKIKENGNITDEALKLIVKMSEGSVRDALSLLDRAIISTELNDELDLKKAQKIFGHFDKSSLINLFESIFSGEEEKVLNIYKSIYNQGIEPKIFLNDFLELLYFFKNINSLKIESTNFSLNDEQFKLIKNLAGKVENDILILFWQFTIKTLGELDIVANQNLSVEMFLIRLIYLKKSSASPDKDIFQNSDKNQIIDKNKSDYSLTGKKTVDQIKNLFQQDKSKKPDTIKDTENEFKINSFEELIKICIIKKEMQIKYELENNVNLVNFEQNRIEISFNENLSKDFIKKLSAKLFEWTKERWVITLSQEKGKLTKKETFIDTKKKKIENAKKTSTYKKVKDIFSDAELIDVE